MTDESFESPWGEWPETKPTNDGGVHITAMMVQPMLPGRVRALGIIAGIIVAIVALSIYEAPGPAFVAVAVFTLIWFAARPGIYRMLGKKVDVKIYPDKIQVRDGSRYKSYSRDVPLEFRYETHEKATQEEINAMRTGNEKYRVFREALQVVMQYGEKRVPIAEMRIDDLEKARALVLRLQTVSAAADKVAKGMGEEGKPARPKDEFGPATPIR